jgi:hypothetical protein
MIEVVALPRNQEHVARLLSFCAEVIFVCDELGIEPVLSSSLAVFAYAKDPEMEVNDVDLSCRESDFQRLEEALRVRGMTCQVTDWHVLQVRRGELKVEFDSQEFWLSGLSGDTETLRIGRLQVAMVSLNDLKDLYRRGQSAMAAKSDGISMAKHTAIRRKLEALEAIR